MTVNLVLATGVAYSVIGALILVTSHRALYHTATRLVAGHPRDLTALRIQQHDARSGLILLACGTLLQVIAACGYVIPPAYWRYPTATLLGVVFLYGIWRLLATRRIAHAGPAVGRGRSVRRVYETRRSQVLLAAAIQEAANRDARELAKGPRDRSVVYVAQEWECRWWSDKLGVSQYALRAAVQHVGPMVADVERYFRQTRTRYARAA